MASAMQASSRFSAQMTTLTPLLKTMRTVLPRPSFPVQPPSPLSLRTMTTKITAALVPLSTRGDDARETDLPAAESVRPKHEPEAGDNCTFDVQADGFVHHNRQLRIAMSEPGRLIAGQVADPVLWNVPDTCTEAAMEWGWPKMAAKPTMQDGRLKALCIMDERRIDAPSGLAG